MNALLALSRLIDSLNEFVGRTLFWAVLVVTVLSTAVAIGRYMFNVGSNAYLELQWYLFGAIFLLGAGYALKHGAHVRIDAVAGHLSKRTQAWIDVFGTVFMLLPACIIIAWFGWESFQRSFAIMERSSDAGGLIRWPAKLLVPAGFALLILQGLSELIKRIAFLRGLIDWAGPGGSDSNALPDAMPDTPASAKGQ
jgi:TRAP-type mannitol/chloroaromatic compound transport system permease small subunit